MYSEQQNGCKGGCLVTNTHENDKSAMASSILVAFLQKMLPEFAVESPVRLWTLQLCAETAQFHKLKKRVLLCICSMCTCFNVMNLKTQLKFAFPNLRFQICVSKLTQEFADVSVMRRTFETVHCRCTITTVLPTFSILLRKELLFFNNLTCQIETNHLGVTCHGNTHPSNHTSFWTPDCTSKLDLPTFVLLVVFLFRLILFISLWLRVSCDATMSRRPVVQTLGLLLQCGDVSLNTRIN